MAKNKYKSVDKVAGILAVVGALNWGLEVINANAVSFLENLIKVNAFDTVIYSIVGLSAVWIIVRSLMGKFMKK